MVKKYVKGSLKNPKGVIKALEELGGINRYHKTGDCTNAIYFIDKDNDIYCEEKDTQLAIIIMECFEEIQPTESTPTKVITNIDVAKWYFNMLREGHAVQFMHNGQTFNHLWDYYRDGDETDFTEVRIDFGKWIPIKEAVSLVINILVDIP